MRTSGRFLLSCTSALAFLVAGITGAAADRGYTWSGLYLGLHAGGVQSETDWKVLQGNTTLADLDQRDGALIGGAQIGFQQQFGNVVAGVEVSWSGTQLEKTRLLLGENWSSQIDQMVLVTGRLGWAMDRSLLYVKGGWATASYEFSLDHPGLGNHGSSSGWHQGWTVGGGWEYALTPLVSLGVEYNLTRIDIDNHPLTQGPLACINNCRVEDARSDIQSVMARLNFKLK